jgi:predicted GIY-YIG superfamily endonuclease
MYDQTEGIYGYSVYVAPHGKKTVLYVGVANNVRPRVEERQSDPNPKSVAAQYDVHYLV